MCITANKDSPSSNTTGASNKDSKYACVICFIEYDSKENASYGTTTCLHLICRECSRTYFKSLLKEAHFDSNNDISCPGHNCKEVFNNIDDIYLEIFSPEEERDWWNGVLIKTYIKNEVRCPMNRCTGVFDVSLPDLEFYNFSECYECRKGFCMTCRLPWNEDHEENGTYYQKHYDRQNDQAIWEEHNRTLDLAEEQGWARCPKCAHIVSITEGCNNIMCRCGAKFCFHCGRLSVNYNDQCYNFDTPTLSSIRGSMFDH